MGIQISQPFCLKAQIPLDNRLVFETKNEMNNIDKNSIYEGILSYCKQDKNYYSFSNGNWNIFPVISVPEWNFEANYVKNQLVSYDKVLYKTLNTITNSQFDPRTDVANFMSFGGTGGGSSTVKFLPFTKNYSYSYLEVIRHNGILYTAKKSFESSDEFNIDDWELTSGDLKSTNLDTNNNGVIDKADHAKIADIALESTLLSTWKKNTQYDTNQQVVFNNKIYTVINNHVSGNTFDDTKDNMELMASGHHNDLINIDGGNNNEFYHVSKNTYEAIKNISLDVNGKLLNNNLPIGDMAKLTYDKNNNGIVDTAETLNGMTVSIKDINLLAGIKSNVQEQINTLTSIANFTQTVPTYADMLLITGNEKDMVIITADETHGNITTIYVNDGNEFKYVSPFTANIRDFSINPINILSESTGIYSEDRIDPLIARKSDIIQLNNSDLLQTYTQTETDIADSILKKHKHNNLTLLNTYTQTNADLANAVNNKHKHSNGSLLDDFSTNAEGKLLFRGSTIESSGGSGIVDLNNFTTADLLDSINRRYVSDVEKSNLNSLSSIISNQANNEKKLNDIKSSIPNDVNQLNPLISTNILDNKISSMKLKDLSDVSKNVTKNSFLMTNDDGSEILFKQSLTDLMTFPFLYDMSESEFKDHTKMEFSDMIGTSDGEGKVTFKLKNIFSTDIKDMPDDFIENAVLVSNSSKKTYELKNIADLTNSHENKTFDILSTDFSEYGDIYKVVLQHGLNSSNIIYSCYDGFNEFKDTLINIIDDDTIVLFSKEKKDLRVVINCSQGVVNGTSNSVTIYPVDFLDDTKVRTDKTYSSDYIENILLANYLKKNDGYNKNQADARFSLKINEHYHTNKNCIDKFDESLDGKLIYNGKELLSDINITTHQENFTEEESLTGLKQIMSVSNIMDKNKYSAVMSSEFIVRNNIPKVDEETDNLSENQLRLVIMDDLITVLDVNIKPYETQKYSLGISPNSKIFIQGKYTANFYMTAY